ncbi:MAG: hypothetical protein APG11_01875 [Candidatus Methanofastidiosum methylothiophilum]|uniref:Uncharacterized protein n=1 Tax=Candidatus Methanofastidiosum methylothiophilum TaxID=1705564 RepID=A0A150INQ0_9EURY|nr:MAG: hypothetical protein APG11_01875 [Candidatus Methanofastidiosum methylthiophilus]
MGLLFMGFVLSGFVLGTILMCYEDRVTSRMEQVLGIQIKKFNCKSMGCYTYEGLSWLLLIYLSILAIFLFYPVVIGYTNFPGYIGCLFLLIYPEVVMIIRNGTFNDDSIPSPQNPVYVGPNMVSGGPGYNPLYYLLFSFAIGGVSTIWGFSMLNFPNIPVSEGFFLVLVGLIFQTLVLFPDVINWVSPVDLRTKKGVQLMSGVTVTLVLILIILRAISSMVSSVV